MTERGSEKTVNVVLCGLGGQGILFMTRILALTAMVQGHRVLGAETHGMAQRGGSVVSHLRIGEAESSLVRAGTAHFLLALDENEGYRNLPFVARKGMMVVNAADGGAPRDAVSEYLTRNQVGWRAIPAARLAMEMRGTPLDEPGAVGVFRRAKRTALHGHGVAGNGHTHQSGAL